MGEEVRIQNSEVRSQKSEFRSQKSEVRRRALAPTLSRSTGRGRKRISGRGSRGQANALSLRLGHAHAVGGDVAVVEAVDLQLADGVFGRHVAVQVVADEDRVDRPIRA